jgi:biotin transport system substrate-specific component
MKSLVQNPSSSSSKYFVIRVFLGVMLMFISAQVQIPLEPVPVTLHTVGTLIIALIYTRAEAISALSMYLVIGALGAPVFSEFDGGIRHLAGPTAGYLVGMLFCVYIVTSLRQKFGEKSMMHLLVYSAIGSVTVFAFGVPWLAYLIGFEKAIQFGLLPFIIPGCVKAIFTASTVRLFKQKPWISKS